MKRTFNKEDARRYALANFGDAVLNILTREKDWNPDTLDEIATYALGAGLAESDDHGNFCRSAKA